MFKKIIFIAISLILLTAFQWHKHYVSLCEVEYKQDKKELQIVLSLFTDDFEKAVLREIDGSFDIDSLSEATKKSCITYLNKHLQFEIDGKPYNYQYIGKEFDGRKIFFYVQIANIKIQRQLKVKNTLLIKQFEGQKNVVKIKIGRKNKSFYLNKNEHFADFNL